ncbi:MAG TPA: hypothetical protein VF533_08890 [Solirubrobacteraceae bacterium]|jgi:DnaJ-class molecular chaperone
MSDQTQPDMAPGDEIPPGTPNAGAVPCPECGGSGRRDDAECGNCAGTGEVVEAVGGG